MKTKLLILAIIGIFSVNAQTTHNLDWFAGIGSNVDLTITSGDTVIWTWTSPNHTVENVEGSSVETFNSGFLDNVGSTYEYTFTVVGDNDYFCGVHGAASMSGTITVEQNLSVDDVALKTFEIAKNPVDSNLQITLSQPISEGNLIIHDLLGKQVKAEEITNLTTFSLDVSALNKGFYLITINSENSTLKKRFIKN